MNPTNQDQRNDYAAFTAEMPLPAPVKPEESEISPDNPSWTSASAFGFWVLSLLIIAVVPAIVALAYIAVQDGGVSALNEPNALLTPQLIAVQIIGVFPAHLLTLLLAWLIVTRGGKQSFWQTLGWRWNGFGLWSCIGTTILLYLFALLVIGIVGEIETPFSKLLRSSRTAVVATAILAALTAPLVEEVVYRGIMYSAFQRWLGATGGVVLVTLLFAAVHVPQYLPNYAVIAIICLLSLVLTVVRARAQSLLPCFVIHTIFNGIQAVGLILEPYINKTTPGV